MRVPLEIRYADSVQATVQCLLSVADTEYDSPRSKYPLSASTLDEISSVMPILIRGSFLNARRYTKCTHSA
jgi:hypothetical protein